MHKKDRPTLTVTSLLYNSTPPNPNPILFSPNSNLGSVTSSIGQGNGLTISGNGTSPNATNNSNLIQSTTNNHHNHQHHNALHHQNSPLDGSMTPIICDNNNNQNHQNQNRYPPNHPLSGSKHLCAICEDRASGKHYGVYSCEGCKGFFKRTVRKDLTYICRDEGNCIVDKKQRNRCQFCRYQKCLEKGMKREAVQEERQRSKPENEPESSTNSPTLGQQHLLHQQQQQQQQMQDNLNCYLELNIERLTEAEKAIETHLNTCSSSTKIATKEIELLFLWIRHIPYFNMLDRDDQLILLKSGWNELLIAEFSYRSTKREDALLLANGVELSKQNSQSAGVGDIFSRVLNELVVKMRQMQMDPSELGCLRAIVLFNPATKSLRNPNLVEKLRDRVYLILNDHCRTLYPIKTSRFAKLLVRLPALRSIGLKCVEHLFFQQFLEETNRHHTIDEFIMQMLNPEYSLHHRSMNINNSILH